MEPRRGSGALGKWGAEADTHLCKAERPLSPGGPVMEDHVSGVAERIARPLRDTRRFINHQRQLKTLRR